MKNRYAFFAVILAIASSLGLTAAIPPGGPGDAVADVDCGCTGAFEEAAEYSRTPTGDIWCYKARGCITSGAIYYVPRSYCSKSSIPEDKAFKLCPPGSTSEDDAICVEWLDCETAYAIDEAYVSRPYLSSIVGPLWDTCVLCVLDEGEHKCYD